MSSSPFRATELEGIDLLQSLSLVEEGVPHGFTLRTGAFGDRENGERDREWLRRGLGFSRLGGMHQVHGNDVEVLDGNAVLRCDGLLTDEGGAGVFVQSADCVPLLLWASKAKAVAAVHAGWRGTLARIASRAVSRLNDVYGASSEEIHAAIGPAIRVCCYEVGDEVISAFAESGRDIERISRPGPRGRRHLDLVEENRRELVSSGVPAERVYDSGLCTFCGNDRFYSFRKEGSGVGRIFGVIGFR
ncbi:MAG: peptidoglycan editing factor PgeF [Vicinamibacteria bacterium]